MDTPARASDLLATPVRTDADVLARIGAIIDAEARAVPALWLFFLGHDGLQNNVVVPVDDIPEFPDPRLVSNVCYIVSRVLAETPGGSAVITLSRPGPASLGEPDLEWLHAIQEGAAAHRTPIRMLCLATPSGVRELGPVRGTPGT